MKPIQLTEETINSACDAVRQYLNSGRMLTGKVEVQLPTYGVCKTELRPTVMFTKEAEDKMKALVRICNTEIGWHGTVTYDAETNTYTIHDIFVFPQTITGTTVNSIDEKYGPWLMSLEDEVFDTLRFHGHSHVNMSTFASGVDTNHQETLLEDVEDFYIFMIINKRDDTTVFIYDKENNIMYENKDINVVFAENETDAWAKETMEEYLVKPVVKTPTYAQHYGGYNYNYNKPAVSVTGKGIKDTIKDTKRKLSTYEEMLRETKPYLYSNIYTEQGGYYE